MSRADFERYPITDPWSKMLVVTGQPGNRSDLVGGWLAASHPQYFTPAPWYMNPIWGSSMKRHDWNWLDIDTSGNWQSEHNTNLTGYIRDIFKEQHRSGARWASTKSHYTSDVLLRVIPEELAEHFIILDIIINDNESQITVDWEAFVKNIIRLLSSSDPADHAMAEKNLVKNLDKLANTDGKTLYQLTEIKYNIINTSAKTGKFYVTPWYNTSNKDTAAKVISLDYRELMTADAPEILSQHLGLKLDPAIWDTALAMSRSRDRYHWADRWWVRYGCE
jgi:hypothetical protein